MPASVGQGNRPCELCWWEDPPVPLCLKHACPLRFESLKCEHESNYCPGSSNEAWRAHCGGMPGGADDITDGNKQVALEPRVPLDLDEDSPELETELLKAIDGPFEPYSSQEMRAIGERIIREKQGR